MKQTILCCAGTAILAGMAWFGTGCIQVRTAPIQIEPIYIEITINHRIQRELEDLFGDLDRASETVDYQPLEIPENQP